MASGAAFADAAKPRVTLRFPPGANCIPLRCPHPGSFVLQCTHLSAHDGCRIWTKAPGHPPLPPGSKLHSSQVTPSPPASGCCVSMTGASMQPSASPREQTASPSGAPQQTHQSLSMQCIHAALQLSSWSIEPELLDRPDALKTRQESHQSQPARLMRCPTRSPSGHVLHTLDSSADDSQLSRVWVVSEQDMGSMQQLGLGVKAGFADAAL